MFWWILTIILGLAMIGGILWQIFSCCDMAGGVLAALTGIAFIILLFVCIFQPVSCEGSVYVFKEQKEFYEEHITDNKLEDVALTQIKIEQNNWLYSAQFMKKNYPFFSFQPDEVLELEPIE